MATLSKKVKVAKRVGAFRNSRDKVFPAQMSTESLKQAIVSRTGAQKNKIVNELTKRQK